MVVQSLGTLSEDENGKVRGYLSSNNLISSSPLVLMSMYFLTQSPYQRCFKERIQGKNEDLTEEEEKRVW